MSRIRPFDNDEDETCGDGPQGVGQGCAEFVPAEESGADNLRTASKFVLRMRKAGATYVKLGDVEVSFMQPSEKSDDSKS